MNRGATITPSLSKQIVTSSKYRVAYISGGAMFPAWSPTRWTCCARTGKIEIPCLCPAVRPQRALPAGVGERGEGYQQGVLGEVFSKEYRSGTFGIKASGFCAPIFFSPQLSWAPSTPTRPRASCCWTRKSNPQHQNPGRVQTSGVVLCRRGFTGAAGTDQSHSS